MSDGEEKSGGRDPYRGVPEDVHSLSIRTASVDPNDAQVVVVVRGLRHVVAADVPGVAQ